MLFRLKLIFLVFTVTLLVDIWLFSSVSLKKNKKAETRWELLVLIILKAIRTTFRLLFGHYY